MMSATPIPEKPLARNKAAAASMMRSRFAAACSRLTRMSCNPILQLVWRPIPRPRLALDKLYDDRHQSARMMMSVI
jgi:hypothetical protein